MKSIILSIISILFIFLTGCMSKEEKTTHEFVGHVKSLNIDELKRMSTEDTQFYLRITVEALTSMANEQGIDQLKQLASSLECSENDNGRICSFLDENGQKQSFALAFVEGYDEQGTHCLLVDIDRKFFLGE